MLCGMDTHATPLPDVLRTAPEDLLSADLWTHAFPARAMGVHERLLAAPKGEEGAAIALGILEDATSRMRQGAEWMPDFVLGNALHGLHYLVALLSPSLSDELLEELLRRPSACTRTLLARADVRTEPARSYLLWWAGEVMANTKYAAFLDFASLILQAFQDDPSWDRARTIEDLLAQIRAGAKRPLSIMEALETLVSLDEVPEEVLLEMLPIAFTVGGLRENVAIPRIVTHPNATERTWAAALSRRHGEWVYAARAMIEDPRACHYPPLRQALLKRSFWYRQRPDLEESPCVRATLLGTEREIAEMIRRYLRGNWELAFAVLERATPEQLAELTPLDLQPLIQSEYLEIRERAIRLVGKVAQVASKPSIQREKARPKKKAAAD
jgi:hypothetical protein